jgi:hypothetical protein
MIWPILKYPGIFALSKLNLHGLYKLRHHSFLSEVGWLNSFQHQASVDQNNRPIPWMNYACLYFLEPRIHRDMTVFEYGCGNSTIWWSQHVSEVISCEHDLAWYQKILAIKPENAEIFQIDLQDGKSYSHKIAEYQNRFDIVVIDGRNRVNCAKNALAALKAGGVIIWDNTDRQEYQPGIDFLHEQGFKKIDFFGMVPVTTEGCVTSIFYKSKNCLDI